MAVVGKQTLVDWRRNRVAAWLAFFALAAQSLIPFIIALEVRTPRIDERLRPESAPHAAHAHHQEHRPSDGGPRSGNDGHGVCPICYCLSVAKIFAAPLGVALPRPEAGFGDRPALIGEAQEPPSTSPAAYSPRAPPLTV
jgi:hypothetical protein